MCADYDSNFGSESESEERRSLKRTVDTLMTGSSTSFKKPKPPKSEFVEETDKNERKLRTNFQSLDAYSRHKLLINEYVLTYPGSTSKLTRNTSRDKTEYEVLLDNHRFIWDEESEEDLSWGQRLALKYYNKLFKEYCISDLSRYKENKFGMRWRTEREVVEGKGQFSCGSKHCDVKEDLRTWEVFFAYLELGEKKSALVKLRLCPKCSTKLNYKHKRKEIKRRKREDKSNLKESPKISEETISNEPQPSSSSEGTTSVAEESESGVSQVWSKPKPVVDIDKPIDDEFDEYLEDLLL